MRECPCGASAVKQINYECDIIAAKESQVTIKISTIADDGFFCRCSNAMATSTIITILTKKCTGSCIDFEYFPCNKKCVIITLTKYSTKIDERIIFHQHPRTIKHNC